MENGSTVLQDSAVFRLHRSVLLGQKYEHAFLWVVVPSFKVGDIV